MIKIDIISFYNLTRARGEITVPSFVVGFFWWFCFRLLNPKNSYVQFNSLSVTLPCSHLWFKKKMLTFSATSYPGAANGVVVLVYCCRHVIIITHMYDETFVIILIYSNYVFIIRGWDLQRNLSRQSRRIF